MSRTIDRLRATRETAAARAAAPVRIVTGLIFVLFGAGKFIAHTHEAESFDKYGLPAPDVFVYLIGSLELIGGAMLVVGLFTRLAALALAGNMVGAITTAGVVEGGAINLGLAPLLLLAMLFLIWVGPGTRSIDERLRSARPQPTPAQPR